MAFILKIANALTKGRLSYKRIMRAIELDKHNDVNKAIEELKLALEMDPNNGSAMQWLAYLYDKTDQPEAAFDILMPALDNVPGIEETWYNLADSFSENGSIDKAIQCYKRVLRINPNHFDALNNLGWVYSNKKGMLNDALALRGGPHLLDSFGAELRWK